MKKINILIIIITLSLPYNISLAETKPECSKYTGKNLSDVYDKIRCQKGKPPRKKFNLNKLNIFKKKN